MEKGIKKYNTRTSNVIPILVSSNRSTFLPALQKVLPWDNLGTNLLLFVVIISVVVLEVSPGLVFVFVSLT